MWKHNHLSPTSNVADPDLLDPNLLVGSGSDQLSASGSGSGSDHKSHNRLNRYILKNLHFSKYSLQNLNKKQKICE